MRLSVVVAIVVYSWGLRKASREGEKDLRKKKEKKRNKKKNVREITCIYLVLPATRERRKGAGKFSLPLVHGARKNLLIRRFFFRRRRADCLSSTFLAALCDVFVFS